MTLCDYCGREMLKASGCTYEWVEIGGSVYERVLYGDESLAGFTQEQRRKVYRRLADPDHRCHDCAAEIGTVHHFGCDMEECPLCGGQMISCNCSKDEPRPLMKPGS